MQHKINYFRFYIKLELFDGNKKSKDTYKVILHELPATDEELTNLINKELKGYREVYSKYYKEINAVGYRIEADFEEVKLENKIKLL